ncbi:MAG: hypothetical protein N2422_00845 [Rhodobacteraceae bacterium]|nr:hypothetical protein [Paracoccaceae bacterium]
MSRRSCAGYALVVALTALAGPAGAEAPLSAIDWLSESVAEPPLRGPLRSPPGVSRIETVSAPISVEALGTGPTLDGLGVIPAERAGLPHDLWGATPSSDLVRLLRAERTDTLPAIQSLLLTLLLVEVSPPKAAQGEGGQLFLARVDKLLDLGAVDQALALLDLVPDPTRETFRRSFDAALLLGQEDRACDTMRANAQIAPSFPARIFCLARGGDWNAAALSLSTGTALGFIPAEESALLSRFLDPELYEGEPDLPPPVRPSPLVLRMMEAIGQPQTTATLPIAFAHLDLGPTSGWKARIEAAERLVRTGAVDANSLLGLYTERKPAASGGVWDRVAAIQRLDAALAAGDRDAVAAVLPQVWAEMEAAELEVPLAEIYGERLAALEMPGRAGELAFRIGLLSPAYESVARRRIPVTGEEPFLIGLAQGKVGDAAPPDQMGGAIKAAFEGPASDEASDLDRLAGEGRLGEALLRAIDHVTEGARGDLRDVTDGLRFLRRAGLEPVARRAGLELLLLERRG